MESDESARWASRVIGQFETLDLMHSKQAGFFGKGGSHSEQAARRDAVLPSEFYLIPPTTLHNGLTGYFVAPAAGVVKDRILPSEIKPIITSSSDTTPIAVNSRPERLVTAASLNANPSRLEKRRRLVLQFDHQRKDNRPERTEGRS